MSSPAAYAPATAGIPLRTRDRMALAASGGLLVLLALYIADAVSLKMAWLLILGALLGVALYHASFGFTGGWRAFVNEGRGGSLRAQLLMLAVATVLFFPLLAQGSLFGFGFGGFVVPISTALLVGAFLFGLGMQLGGGCGSGTLFTVGGGSGRMVVTLAAFIAGSVIGLWHLPSWWGLPSFGAVNFRESLGTAPAMAVQLAAIGALALVIAAVERRRRGALQPIARPAGDAPLWRRMLRGPWPLVWGAVALAVLNAVTLVTAGHPWGITYAFGLWGSKIAAAGGLDVASWTVWNNPGGHAALEASILTNDVSVMDIGLILGAMLAAALAGKFGPKVDLSPGSLAAAIAGGLLMGYGARLSSGCNIGALFGGIASGSLHGWVWFALAFAGSVVGIRLRPLFGLRD